MSSRLRRTFAAMIILTLNTSARAEEKLVAHEWETFTCLQDENGKAIGGINVDDIPVLETLHKIAPGSLLSVGDGGETSAEGTRCHSQVTMRWEKAVMNFYRATSRTSVDVEVRSYRGWLTQYFPAATVKSPGLSRDHIGTIGPWEMGELKWHLSLRPSPDDAPTPLEGTDEAKPRAARIEADGEEADGLICRGVSKDSAPFRVVRDGPALTISEPHLDISQLWLVEIRADDTISLRVLHPFHEETAFVVKTPAHFASEESSPDNLNTLDELMRAALREAGLFDEEGEALLESLHLAHWHRIGMRLFFLRNKAASGALSWQVQARNENGKWLDAERTHVAVGCIEIVTPGQRALLARIAAGGEEQTVTGQLPKPETLSEARWQQLNQMYGSLGQFRNALLLDEQGRRPSAILEAFIKRFHLESYTPADEWPLKKSGR